MSDKKECFCFIRHAVTETEKKLALEQLNYSRSVGDNIGVMLAMATLAGCPPKR